MIKFVKGNIFESNAEALVNSVNTVGVMGKGIALQFKERFPRSSSPQQIAWLTQNGLLIFLQKNTGCIAQVINL